MVQAWFSGINPQTVLAMNRKVEMHVYRMLLTEEQQGILDGSRGETMAKIMETLVRYGELFGATKMVPVTSEYNHLVTSFGLKAMGPVYELMDEFIQGNALSSRPFTVDPRPLDPAVPSSFLQNMVFKHMMYTRQDSYEKQLKELGLKDEQAFTCACYLKEVGNVPKPGDVLSWSESSAVVYANSILGAHCNRNSGIIDLMGAIVGYVPYFGLLTEEGRKATWIIDVETTSLPEAQLLGSAVGMKVVEDVPYIRGLDRFFPAGLTEEACTYFKDFGAATASNGAVGLYHVEGLTPEAVQAQTELIVPEAQHYIIDDAEIERVYRSYPVMWKDQAGKPELCFLGCPHMSLNQLQSWAKRIHEKLEDAGKKKVAVPTVITTAPAVLQAFQSTEDAQFLQDAGVILSTICPLMYMNNPLSGKKRVITSSNKLRTYTTARYYPEAELLDQLVKW